VIAAAGTAVVLVALTIAVGQWLGWIAGVLRVAGLARAWPSLRARPERRRGPLPFPGCRPRFSATAAPA